jgi:GTP diphosphokinase / guanosine-3',5'-bis(diphosphate) 3'-diphosphatase
VITPEDLVALVRNYNPGCDEGLIRRAWDYGARMHEGQRRQSGEPYFTHPVAVASLLTEMQLDDATIVTALLHDTIEDTRSTHSEVARLFGAEIADLVDGVTKLTNLELSSSQAKQAENFRKLLLAMSRDLRVILVKLADRLHNMRTIRSMRPEKQAQKARETLEIYAPLAGRMGMQWMREELEDLAFKVLNPEARNSIMRRFVTLKRESGDTIARITNDIRLELEKAGIEAAVYGRAKKPYSVWRKLQERSGRTAAGAPAAPEGEGGEPGDLAFSRLSDIYGFRIIVEDVAQCYQVLGLIHQRWRAVPGRFKDYISQPKQNGYRSIHTTVSGRDGKRVEVQIRTRQMHEVAEAGVAAHWAYRDGARASNPFAVDPARWIRTLSERIESGGAEDHDEFLEHVKLEMYSDQVFCFTPKGDVVPLPRGATPLDFAYAIHTRIGNATVSAKIDGRREPLWTRLRNGQTVEIITAEGQRPQASWIHLVHTGRAKAAIRRSLRDEDRERYEKLGRELMRLAFEGVGRRMTERALEAAARTAGVRGVPDLLARVGIIELSARDVVARLYPDLATAPAEDGSPGGEAPVPVLGIEPGTPFRRANCCQPLPGERIVGITYRGKGVVAHAIDCDVLAGLGDQTERWIDLRWAEGPARPVHGITLDLMILNSAGVLGRVCSLIGAQKANITDLRFVDRKPDFFRLIVEIDVSDAAHAHRILTLLGAEADVAQASRTRDPTRQP